MKRIFTLLLGLTLAVPVFADENDEVDLSFVFVDEEGEIIENGSTVVRNTVSIDELGSEVIYSGISVLDMFGTPDVYLKMHYTIERIDNGSYQICFPSTCNYQSEPGDYETAQGQLMFEVQDILSEWFPEADGECIVTLSIELFSKQGMFPPTYVHEAWGPSVTVRFVKGNIPGPGVPGDVNGDGEVNISDVNAVIDMILSQSGDSAGDVNGDGEVNIADVNAVIDLILK